MPGMPAAVRSSATSGSGTSRATSRSACRSDAPQARALSRWNHGLSQRLGLTGSLSRDSSLTSRSNRPTIRCLRRRRPVGDVCGCDDRGVPLHRAHTGVLRSVRLPVRLHRDRGGWPVRRPGSGPGPSDGPRPVRQGQGGSRARLPPRAAPPPAPPDAPEGGPGPGLGAHRMGRGTRPRRGAPGGDRRAGRSPERGVQRGLPVHVGLRRHHRVDQPAHERLRHAEPVRLDGALRMGSIPRADLHLRRCCARRVHARPRARGLHPVLGLQPQRRPDRPRDRHRGRAQARRTPHRRRPAPGRPRREVGHLAPGAARDRRRPCPGHRGGHDRARLVRPRLRTAVDERTAARADRQRPVPHRGRAGEREPRAVRGLGRGGRRPDGVRPRDGSVRRRGTRPHREVSSPDARRRGRLPARVRPRRRG
jgi:hypothetical protein